MNVPQILEVAVGLIVVYYVLGSIVSLITQWINESLETRGAALERYLKKIAGDKVVDLTNLPQMKALQPIRYKNWLSVFGAATEPKKLEKIPVSTLVDAYFDLVGLTGKTNVAADELKAIIGQLPDSEGKTAFLNWIEQGVTNINDLRSRATSYFSGILDQAAATFRANARSFVILFSIGVTLVFGTDSIQLANDLWKNAELRAIAAAQADIVMSQQGPVSPKDLSGLIEDLGTFSLRVGWSRQMDDLPQNATLPEWIRFVLLKIIGLGITAVAVSQGSSFWYDLLKKITSPGRGGGGGGSSDETKG
jgi:hypothetical protein